MTPERAARAFIRVVEAARLVGARELWCEKGVVWCRVGRLRMFLMSGA